jgi:hypothetical protein
MSEWDVGEGRGGLFIENRTHDHENKTLSIRIMLYARFYGLFKVMTCPAGQRPRELFSVQPCRCLFHIWRMGRLNVHPISTFR